MSRLAATLRSVAAALGLALAAWAALAAAARPAGAAPLPTRLTGLMRAGDQLLVSVGLQDLFDSAQTQRLTSGFATRILIRAYLHEEGSDTPLAVAFQRSEIVYDIWDEKYRIRTTRGPGTETRSESKDAREVIARTATLWRFPVATLSQLRPGTRYVLLFRADLNPIPEELYADVRRWLAESPAGQRRLAAGESFFGTFISIFVNPRIEASERHVEFASQPFTREGP